MLILDREMTAKRIAYIIDHSGLSSAEVSRRIGYKDPQNVYIWRRGKALPKVSEFVKLAGVIGCSIDDLIETKEV